MITAAGTPIKTGEPLLDLILSYGLYGVIAVSAYLLLRYQEHKLAKVLAQRDTERAAELTKREADWKEAKQTWEKERTDLFAFRDLSRTEWDKERAELIRQHDQERTELIRQRDLALTDTAESRRTANEALAGVRSFLEGGQKEMLSTLADSNAALKEAALKERALEERTKEKDRELEMLRALLLNQGQRALGSGTGGTS